MNLEYPKFKYNYTCLLLAILAFEFNPSQIVYAADNIAIDGYDTVAYFTLQKATKGNDRFTYQWNGRTWHFTSLKHQELFSAEPAKYAPQFNGFCANGLSDGHAVNANPRNWRIIDGKLYLFFSEYGRDQWSGDVKSLLQNANDTFKEHR